MTPETTSIEDRLQALSGNEFIALEWHILKEAISTIKELRDQLDESKTHIENLRLMVAENCYEEVCQVSNGGKYKYEQAKAFVHRV